MPRLFLYIEDAAQEPIFRYAFRAISHYRLLASLTAYSQYHDTANITMPAFDADFRNEMRGSIKRAISFRHGDLLSL